MNFLSITHSTAFKASSISNPVEHRAVEKAIIAAIMTKCNLTAVKNGAWTVDDTEAVTTKETMHFSREELRPLRIEQLEKEFHKSCKKIVAKLNALNKAYYNIQSEYILDYEEDRDEKILFSIKDFFESYKTA